MSFEFETTPIDVTINDVKKKPTAHIEIKSTDFKTTDELAFLAWLEQTLYGTPAVLDPATPAVPASLPTPAEIYAKYIEIVNP